MKLSLFMVIHMFAHLHVYDVHMHTHVHTMEVGEGGKVRQGGSVSSDTRALGPDTCANAGTAPGLAQVSDPDACVMAGST